MFKLAITGAVGLLALLAVSCHSAPKQKSHVIAPVLTRIEFDHGVITALQVRNLAAAKKWYAEILGCELVYNLPEHGWCELSTPVEHMLIGLAEVEAGTEPGGSGATSLAFAVTHIEQARTVLIAAGVQASEIGGPPGIVKLLEFRDPDGNKLMLYEQLAK